MHNLSFKFALDTILRDYLSAKAHPLRANGIAALLRNDIPQILRQLLPQSDEYKIHGAAGQGNWAAVPWIGVFDRRITESAQHGYYIVYLFDSSMKGVYLSLNQGWTQYEEAFFLNDARKEICQNSHFLRDHLKNNLDGFSFNEIQLSSRGSLGRGYEWGHICGKYYQAGAIPNDSILIADLQRLMNVYQFLKSKVGSRFIEGKLLDLSKEFKFKDEAQDGRYQQEMLNSPAVPPPPGPLKRPARLGETKVNRWDRNPSIARYCLEKSNYLCQCDSSHSTFICRATGKNYVESHHLIPIYAQDRFKTNMKQISTGSQWDRYRFYRT